VIYPCLPVVSALVPLDESSAGGGGTSLTISGAVSILDDVHLGDSISVNGTCLTVTEFTSDAFKVGLAPETLRRTNLGSLRTGSPVNLERAVAGHVRFGGHFVQGHVDTTARILTKTPDGSAVSIRFQPADPGVLVYVVEKGYIALDGTSLTITAVDDVHKWFEVMLVAYTQEKVIIMKKEVGESVNVEVDIVGKYIEKQAKAHLGEDLFAQGRMLENMVAKVVEKKISERQTELD